MNHPRPEELLCYLDGGASPEAGERLGKHLESCPECAAELAGWRRSVEKLKCLPLPASQRLAPPRRLDSLWPNYFLKLAAAAAVVLFLGGAAGRLSTPSVEALKKAVAIQVREELRREMRAENSRLLEDAMRTVQKQRDEDQLRLVASIARVRDQQAADYLALRQDLETVVTTADSDLRQNSQRISQLANSLLAVQH